MEGGAEEEEHFIILTQLRKLQLAVQQLNSDNSRLKLENSLLMEHCAPPLPEPLGPATAGHSTHTALPDVTRGAPLLPSHSAAYSHCPPSYPHQHQHDIASSSWPEDQLSTGLDMQSAVEEVRALQERLENVRSRLQDEQHQLHSRATFPTQPPQHLYLHSLSPPRSPPGSCTWAPAARAATAATAPLSPGGGPDFMTLVEELNSRSCSPHHPLNPHKQSPPGVRGPRSSCSPGARPPWRSPSAVPRSPVVGVSTRSGARAPPGCTQHSPGAVRKPSSCKSLGSAFDKGASRRRGGGRARNQQTAASLRLHYGLPSKH